MKNIPPALLTYLQSAGGAEVATCWKMTLTNGEVMGFTDHDRDIYLDGVTYSAKTGYNRTAVASNATLAVDNMDLEGAVASEGITAAGLRSGLYDYAAVEVFLVKASDPGIGKVILRRGVLGELTLKDGIYVSEIRGMSQYLNRQMTRVVTPECNARVYDDRCKVDPAPYTNTGKILNVLVDRKAFAVQIDGTARDEGFFSHGLITFTSGPSKGRSMEIRAHTVVSGVDRFFLLLPMEWPINDENEFTVRRGCNQLLATCRDVFDNVVNFRGFPDVPGFDKITWYPDDKSK